MLRFAILLGLLGAFAPRAGAETAPDVVADIAPVHALVARVMEGVGTPGLILPQDASPHGYAMRPSQATRVQEAGLVVWMGPGLTPWLSDAIDTLAPDAPQLVLLEVEGTVLLPIRDDEGFGDHDHGHDHGHGHGHDHGDEGIDPHAWLDPENAAIWMRAIATALEQVDPVNAELYRSNAEAGSVEMAQLIQEIAATLAAGSAGHFLVSHDALHYFEARFDRHADGAVTASDAAAAGAAHLADLRAHMKAEGIRCLLVEPGIATDRLASIFGDDIRFADADILGRDQVLGAALYPGLLRAIAQNLSQCTAP